jgi:hypothetical protein
MSSASSSGGTMGSCNSFLSKGSVNTFPRMKVVTSTTTETVFSVGSVQSCVFKHKQDDILDKDTTMDNVQERNICSERRD